MAKKKEVGVSTYWLKFMARFPEIETLPVENWKELHLIAYFCKRFENHFQTKFALSFKGAPSKCPEVYLVKKTMYMLDTIRPVHIKQYIDWIFDFKIIPGKVKIRSMGYLATPSYGNQWKLTQAPTNKIDRSTELPQEFKQVAQKYDLDISTYGELAFIKMSLDSFESETYRQLFNSLADQGFESSALDELT